MQADRADETNSSNSKFLSDVEVETGMLSEPDNKENSIKEVLDKIEDILCETWEETGFGLVIVESERGEKGKNKIQVTVKGSTFYRYYVSDDDVKQWKARS